MGAIGKMMSGVLGALSLYAGPVWAFVVGLLDRVRRSFVALVSSPAVWLASGLVFVVGFWLGHLEGAAGKRAIRAERDDLRTQIAENQRRNDVLSASNREALVTIARIKGELAAAKAVPEPPASPPAAVSRRPVPKAAPTKSAASAPPARPWNPFGDK